MQTTRVVETIVKLWLYFTNEVFIKDSFLSGYLKFFTLLYSNSFVKVFWDRKKKKIYCSVQSINFQFVSKGNTLPSLLPRLFNKTTNNRRNEIYRIVWRVIFNEKTSVHDIKPNFIPLVWARASTTKVFSAKHKETDREIIEREEEAFRKCDFKLRQAQYPPRYCKSLALDFFSFDFFYPSLRYHRRSI